MLYQLSHFRSAAVERDGAESQIRTGDTAIFSRVLYQLSYLGPPDDLGTGPVRTRWRIARRPRASKDAARPQDVHPTRGEPATMTPSVEALEAEHTVLIKRRLARQRPEPVDPVDDRRMS